MAMEGPDKVGYEFTKYVYIAGTWDPTVQATYGIKGTLYVRVGPSGGAIYQKNDDGYTTNWVINSAIIPASVEVSKDGVSVVSILSNLDFLGPFSVTDAGGGHAEIRFPGDANRIGFWNGTQDFGFSNNLTFNDSLINMSVGANTVNSPYSFAFGDSNTLNSGPSRNHNFVFGDSNVTGATATRYSFIVGSQITIAGNFNNGFGDTHTISGSKNFVTGDNHSVVGSYLTAFGSTNILAGTFGFSYGTNINSDGDYSFCLGDTITQGTGSYINFAFGETLNIDGGSADCFVFGVNCSLTGSRTSTYLFGTNLSSSFDDQFIIGDTNVPDTNDAFQVGIGGANGFQVGKDGLIQMTQGGQRVKIRHVNVGATYNLDSRTDYIVVALSAITFNLPAGVTGQTFIVKNGHGSAMCSVAAFAGDSIEGAASLAMIPSRSYTLVYYALTSTWYITAIA